MRAALLLALFALGLAAAGAAVVRSSGPVRPGSRWSLSERLQALRIDRALLGSDRALQGIDRSPSLDAQKSAALTLRGDKALFEVHEPAGPVLLRCPATGNLPVLYASYAASGGAAGCEAQAADDGGDVRLYELAGRASPPLPGEAATLADEQLQAALYLPALAVTSGAPLSAMKPGRLSACGAGQANCALSLSAGAIVYCGDLRTCAEGACFQGRTEEIQPDEVAASLAYAQAATSRGAQISEAITPATAQRFVESPPWGAEGPGSAETARDLRGFFDKHPRGLCLYLRGLDVERPREARLAAEAMAFPIFAPFDPRAPERISPLFKDLQRALDDEGAAARLSCDLPGEQACKDKRERTVAQLRAALGKLGPPLAGIERDELAWHVGASGPFQLSVFDGLRVRLESKGDVAKSRSQRGKLVVSYQPLWPESMAERRARCQAQGSVCLFRAVWGSAGQPDPGFDSLVGLFARPGTNTRCVRRLFDALAASKDLPRLQTMVREPLDEPGRCARPTSLLPQANCATPTAPYGSSGGGGCGPVRLAFFADEPWARLAADVASVAARQGIAVQLSQATARGGDEGDVLLSAATSYTRADFPSLAPLAGPLVSPRGRDLLDEYEASLAFPADAPRSRAEVLALLEEDVARRGPAPIFTLAFAQPRSLALPEEQAEPARSPWYLPRLYAAWTSR
jgi:hypothetical protein